MTPANFEQKTIKPPPHAVITCPTQMQSHTTQATCAPINEFHMPKCDRITLIIDKMQQNKTNLCLNLIVDHQLTCKTASISSSSLGRVHIHQIHTRASKPYPKRRKPAHAACSQRTPTKRTSKLANAACPSATLSNCIQYNSSPTKDKTKCANGPLCTTHDNGTTKIDTK